MVFYQKELKQFNQKHIDYVIVGGTAFNLLGGFRSTADLDVLIDLTEKNLTVLIKILSSNGYKLFQPINPLDILDKNKRKVLFETKNLKTLRFVKENSLQQIDIIIDSPISFAKAKKSVIVISVDGLKLPVVGINELIMMKKAAWRPIDQADIAELKVIKKLKDH